MARTISPTSLINTEAEKDDQYLRFFCYKISDNERETQSLSQTRLLELSRLLIVEPGWFLHTFIQDSSSPIEDVRNLLERRINLYLIAPKKDR